MEEIPDETSNTSTANVEDANSYKAQDAHKVEKMTQQVDLNSLGGGGGFGLIGGNGGDGGLLGGLLVGALLGRGNGLFGGNDGHNNALPEIAVHTAILQGVNDISSAVPTAALQVQNAILTQTNDLTNQNYQGTLASLAAAANVKDAVQGGTLANLTATGAVKEAVQGSLIASLAAGTANTNAILAAVQGVKDQGTMFRIADLERQLGVAQVLARDEGFHRRMDGVEVNVAQTVNQNQVQAQAQAQAQLQGFLLQGIAAQLAENTQISRATNANLIIGNTGASTTGAQTASPVNVNGV